MSNSMTENLLEWIGTFKSVSDDEYGETRVCIFVEDKCNKLPRGFGSAEEIARNRATYFDGTIPAALADEAIHIGCAEDLDFEALTDISENYEPKYAGRTLDGYAVIIANPRGTVMPAARNLYSPEQAERLDVWLGIISGIEFEQTFVIALDEDESLVFDSRLDMMSTDFIDEFGDIKVDILDEALYDGYSDGLTWGVIDVLTTREFKGLLCSADGILVLLY